MYADYSKLWKLLIDKKMKKSDLMAVSGISRSTINKLTKSENVNMEIILKICSALECNVGDIVDARK